TLVGSLRKAGALGTSESLLYAFGVHINAEIPATDALTITRYLRAFALAQDWLVEVHRVNLSRRVAPFIDLYSSGYRKTLLAYTDDTTLDTVIDDYLHFNPTRNRALDMLPLFKHIDEARVNEAVSDARVNARPTFHYRLPNCEINLPGWSLAHCWNPWCVLEALAGDPALLDELAAQYRAYDAHLINLRRPPWHRRLDELLHDLA
ncbi:MAG: amidoligase family protein, partial [Halioglobus sp.]|nr:amidoligase family protein [Halioglobus sp.]